MAIRAPVPGTIHLATLTGLEQVAIASGAGNVTTTTQAIGNLASGNTGLSGMTAAQVPVAATATTVTSSLPTSGTTGVTEIASATSAAKTSGHLATWDANGNLVDGGAVPAAPPVTSVAAQIGAITFGHFLATGGAAGNITATGILSTSTLLEVIQFIGSGTAVTTVADLTSQFTVTGANTINNTGGTDTTGSVLLVRWVS